MISEKRLNDFKLKLEALRMILTEKKAKALLIESQSNFSWLTAGRGFIGLASTEACGTLVVTMNKVYLVATNIEIYRLMTEQLEENHLIEIKDYPWHLPNKKQEIINEIIDNQYYVDETSVTNDIFNIRTIMSEYDKERYRDLSINFAKILENICVNLKVGMTEYELAGEISEKLWSENIEPVTILIAFDQRAPKYRHPVPTNNKLKNYAFISACGRRAGLITSATRTVCINKPSEELLHNHRMCGQIDAILTSETYIGNNLSDIFKTAVDYYKQLGFENEWLLHHQGGLTGYIPRELKATFDSQHIIKANEVYAWNPTIQGTGVEDTILVTEKGIEVLTYTGDFEYIEYEVNGKKILKSDILILNK